MDKLLEKYNLPKLNQKERESVNRPIIALKLKLWLKKIFQQTKTQGQAASQVKSTKSLEKSWILLKLFQKIAKEGELPNSFYEATITLIQESDKDTTRTEKLQASITDARDARILQYK